MINYHISKSKAVNAAFTNHGRESSERVICIKEADASSICQYGCIQIYEESIDLFLSIIFSLFFFWALVQLICLTFTVEARSQRSNLRLGENGANDTPQ